MSCCLTKTVYETNVSNDSSENFEQTGLPKYANATTGRIYKYYIEYFPNSRLKLHFKISILSLSVEWHFIEAERQGPWTSFDTFYSRSV